MQGEMQYPPLMDAPNYNAANYYPPPLPVSHRCDIEFSFPSELYTYDSIRRPRKFHIGIFIGMTQLPNLSQSKHNLSLR